MTCSVRKYKVNVLRYFSDIYVLRFKLRGMNDRPFSCFETANFRTVKNIQGYIFTYLLIFGLKRLLDPKMLSFKTIKSQANSLPWQINVNFISSISSIKKIQYNETLIFALIKTQRNLTFISNMYYTLEKVMKKVDNLDHYFTSFLLIILVVFAGETRAGPFWLSNMLPDHFDQLLLNNVSENCHVRKVKCISI